MKLRERMHENPDRRDSARREDPVAKELRFDRVTRREKKQKQKQNNGARNPSEGQNRGKRRTHGRETQQAEKTIGRSLSEREGTQQEINLQENPAQDRGGRRRRATKRRGDPRGMGTAM